jgi:hypothetical protein
MKELVKVKLVFPRSGQRLFVYLPSHLAQAIDAQRHTRLAIRVEQANSTNNPDFAVVSVSR